jgi:hypothetical protein
MVTPNSPGEPGDGVDTEGKAVPPYEGRRETADVDGPEKASRDGAAVGGATGPVEDDRLRAPAPGETPRGATGSPSDEQPASEMPETDLDDDRAGPAHEAGTGRAEDKP